jgi:hypothetical protein
MSHHRIRSRASHVWTALAALAVAAAIVGPAEAGAQNGFLLGTPSGSVSIRAGYDHALAGSDIFNDPTTTGQLTLSKSSYSGPQAAVDLGVRLSDRLDVVLGSSYAGSRARSEYRDFIDNNNLPIEQTTTFQRVPITGSLKMYLTSRGRSIGRFAWVPNRVSPYVGGGGGFIWYKFQQQGDFIDFNSSNQRVFNATYASSNWTAEAHAFAGLDYSINPRLALTAETRYTWGRAGLSADFSGFQRIDLSGIGATAGLSVRF